MSRYFSVHSFLVGTFLTLGCRQSASPEVEATSTARTRATSTSQASAGGNFELTLVNTAAAPSTPPKGMVWVPGGEFSMGSQNPMAGGLCHEPMDDARPIHRVRLSGYYIDTTEVTNQSFGDFVEATGYITIAERTPTADELPGVAEADRVAGSVVFTPPSHAVPLDRPIGWWRYVAGANWRHPGGPGTSITGLEQHPVVHVAYADALAYANWAGKDLPSEAEWEFAARGSKSGQLYPWGNDFAKGGVTHANTYQGDFPTHDTGADGFAGTAPVGSYPSNDFGLHDVAGNVWEWTRDWYRSDTYSSDARRGLATDPVGPGDSLDPTEPRTPKRVQRGGSFLCTDAYCTRYMVGTRGKGEPNSASNHIGFRCVKRVSPNQPVR
jgi:formylglycine-generating enzyme